MKCLPSHFSSSSVVIASERDVLSSSGRPRHKCLVCTTPSTSLLTLALLGQLSVWFESSWNDLEFGVWFSRPWSLKILGGKCGARCYPFPKWSPVEILKSWPPFEKWLAAIVLDILPLRWVSQSVKVVLITTINCSGIQPSKYRYITRKT
jgi:hypothetical protein